jgi:hypothetical protein
VALDVTWSPAAGLYTARVWHETESDTLGEARNSWMQADPQWLAEVGGARGVARTSRTSHKVAGRAF